MVRQSSTDTLAASSEDASLSSGSATAIGSRRPSKTLSDPFLEAMVTSSKVSTSADSMHASTVLGQFSYAPATKTTVVTTTTTTTTSFPPLVIKTPGHLHELDARLYPLAASPTPSAIKKITFNLGGRSTVFRELDSASKSTPTHIHPSSAHRSSKRIRRSSKAPEPELLEIEGAEAATPEQKEISCGDATRGIWNATPPVSIADAAHLVNAQQAGARASDSRELRRRRHPSRRQANLSRLQICQTATPVTPSPALCTSQQLAETRVETRVDPRSETRADVTSQSSSSRITQVPSPRHAAESLLEPLDQDETSRTRSGSRGRHRSSSIAAMQPHDLRISLSREEEALPTSSTVPSTSTAASRRPRPTVLDTAAIQDASLPSPGLSPVTAAANLQREYFASSHTSREAIPSVLSSPPQDFAQVPFANLPRPPTRRQDTTPSRMMPEPRSTSWPNARAGQTRVPSMLQVPEMLETFESMPSEMKTYVMYQLLRRCPKPVLHFVAGVVDPVLRCDYLELLPIELSQQIISHLDLRSLCAAAQVSRKWRSLVDSDEKVWKNRFDADGFVMPPGELQQAIVEGWGWQFGSAPHDCEQNIGDPELSRRSGPWSLALAPPGDRGDGARSIAADLGASGSAKRPKRKAAAKSKPASRKQQKKKETRIDGKAEFDYDALFDHQSSSDGPYAAARAASRAVPISQIGLPTLRNLHLYKSLYRRHHLISRSWMQERIKPRHLAFKAHGRHVITCLQFDHDKILTGSDDTNINVYDTQTGALRARLTGHEGGVWALEYHGNTLVSGSTDRSVRVWDIDKGECRHVFAGHTSTVRCLIILLPTEVGRTAAGEPRMMPEEPLIITGSRDSNLRVWRLPRPDEAPFKASTHAPEDVDCPFFVRALIGHSHSVRAIAAHADTLVSGSYDFTVRVWRISTGETVHRLSGHLQKVYSVVLDHARNRCVSGSMDNLVKVWDLDHGDLLYNLSGHSSLVGLLDLQANRLVSAAADYTLRIWDPETGQCKSTLRAHTGAITCFQHDAYKVISGSDRALKMWDVRTGALTRDLLRDLNGVWQVKFDERRCVAAVQRDGQTYIEVLDYGASRDGVSESQLGKRTVVDYSGVEINDVRDPTAHLSAVVVEE